MDTKSRNIRYSAWIKLAAALLCVAGLLSAAWGLRQCQYFHLAFETQEYARTDIVSGKLWSVYSALEVYPLRHASEADVASGEWLTDDDLRASKTNALDTYNTLRNSAEDRYGEMISRAQQDSGSGDATNQLVAELLNSKQAYLDEIKKEYDASYESARKALIAQEMQEFQAAHNSLNHMDGLYYYARVAGGTPVTNIGEADPEAFFRALPAYRTFPDETAPDALSAPGPYPASGPNAVAWVGMSQEMFDSGLHEYMADRNLGTEGLEWFAGGLLAFVLGIAWLLYAAGRRPCAEGVQVLPGDRVYLDIGLAAAVIVITFSVLSLSWLYSILLNSPSANPAMVMVLAALLVACMAVTAMLYLTSLVKRLKRREAVKHTLVYAVCAWLYRRANGMLNAGPLALKAALLFSGYAFLSALFLFAVIELAHGGGGPAILFFLILFLAVNAGALVYLIRKLDAVRAIQAGVGKLRAGELGYRIPASGGAPFAELADGINNIAEGLDAAVESELKAERMKAELITNVSHDLRTPMTSIITYVDLLKTEGLESPGAAGYVGVLEAKAKRLKALTDDLFEAAKAASGSIKPNIARLDVGELISQGLGELSDRIRESGLDFRWTVPEPGLFIEADGRLLWRVMENLFSNVFKYAMPNSRVYVSASGAGGRAAITVKNISACELNLPAEELMERFTRGDEARMSEGSGLGLAIARSLVELQGGRFSIEIDGDLFKARVEFPEAAGNIQKQG